MKIFGFAGYSGSGKTTLIEQLIPLLAEYAGPVRASAATILSLQGRIEHPKEALISLVGEFQNPNWTTLLETMSTARETGQLSAGVASASVLDLLDLLKAMQHHVQTLK